MDNDTLQRLKHAYRQWAQAKGGSIDTWAARLAADTPD